eukprot:1743609-Rhodomonas_salina.1
MCVCVMHCCDATAFEVALPLLQLHPRRQPWQPCAPEHVRRRRVRAADPRACDASFATACVMVCAGRAAAAGKSHDRLAGPRSCDGAAARAAGPGARAEPREARAPSVLTMTRSSTCARRRRCSAHPLSFLSVKPARRTARLPCFVLNEFTNFHNLCTHHARDPVVRIRAVCLPLQSGSTARSACDALSRTEASLSSTISACNVRTTTSSFLRLSAWSARTPSARTALDPCCTVTSRRSRTGWSPLVTCRISCRRHRCRTSASMLSNPSTSPAGSTQLPVRTSVREDPAPVPS